MALADFRKGDVDSCFHYIYRENVSEGRVVIVEDVYVY